MKDADTIIRIQKTINDIRPRGFFSQVDLYIRAAMTGKRHPGPSRVNAVKKEARAMLSRSAVSLNCLIDFQFGEKGAEKDLRVDFNRIRRLLISLLADITDEIEIIENIIRRSARLQELMDDKIGELEKATRLLDVIRERIAQRPTAVFNLRSEEENIRELNRTFESVREYEEDFTRIFGIPSDRRPVENGWGFFKALMEDDCVEIEKRKERINRRIEELKRGWKLLKVLTKKGCSRRMQGMLDRLMDRHLQRTRRFQEEVRRCRPESGPETFSRAAAAF